MDASCLFVTVHPVLKYFFVLVVFISLPRYNKMDWGV